GRARRSPTVRSRVDPKDVRGQSPPRCAPAGDGVRQRADRGASRDDRTRRRRPRPDRHTDRPAAADGLPHTGPSGHVPAGGDRRADTGRRPGRRRADRRPSPGVTAVVALGGNALTRPGQRGTAAEQLANLREAAAALKPIFDSEDSVAITHGNGPQVGTELPREEGAADEVPPLPLWVAVAQTQAEIGALIRAELAPVAGREVACILTHVVVGEDDPAFGEPSKPIGPFYGADRARMLEEERGWKLVFDAGRGYRRVVPSPLPLEVVELDAVRALLAAGACVVACGGGGVPVARRNGRLQGVDAVVDKDRASALLATALAADRLVVLTDVAAVYRGYRT